MRGHGPLQGRGSGVGAARDRRRRPALALPRRRRHRHRGRAYPQTALTSTSRTAAAPTTHRPNSTPRAGPFTLVPLPGALEPGLRARPGRRPPRLRRYPTTDMAAEIERRAHSILGKIDVEPGRGVFPLAVETATRLRRANRVALVGEAAHVIPPIGAQGLNLGLRDAATHRRARGRRAPRRAATSAHPDLTSRYDTHAPRRRDEPHARGRPAQPQPALGFPAGAGRARARRFSSWTASARCAARSCARASCRWRRSRG